MVTSLEDFLDEFKNKKEEVFVIGGGSIYEQSLSYVDKLYLTIVDDDPVADVYFPSYESIFSKVLKKETEEDGGFNFEYLELVR